jgi:hypothetical protein
MLQGVRNLGLIKLDVEGFELDLVSSLRPWLESLDEAGIGKPAIWLSLHRPFWREGERTMERDGAPDSPLCATRRVASMYKFVYDNSLVDITESFRPTDDKGKGCMLLCTSFCEILLTDFSI